MNLLGHPHGKGRAAGVSAIHKFDPWMSNCEVVELPPIDLEPHQVTEVLRCILHTIIFNRSLGVVKPREVDSELFELTWVST